MEIDVPNPVRNPTAKEFHARRCYLLGITDVNRVEQLWTIERERLRAPQSQA